MKIDNITINLGDESKTSQNGNKITVSADSHNASCADYIKIAFEDSYSIELKESKNGQAVLVLTAGGIHRRMDLNTLQHLVAMTY